MSSAYTSRVSFEPHDPAWQRFLQVAPGGHYMQSGEWAQFKIAFDWRVARLTLQRGGEIVAGAQILVRRLPGLGAVGWAPKAPVLAEPDPELLERLLGDLRHLVKRERIRVLMLQPPPHQSGLLDALSSWGYRPSPVAMGPRATILLDLRPGLETIQAKMRKKTRQHIRRGLREGVTVREGNEDCLETFYRLHVATSERQSFPPYPRRHFDELWRAFAPTGGARLFLAEREAEALSGLLVLVHGNTVHTHAMAWSGGHPKAMANEVLLWSAIARSREHGYSCWDFTWIDPTAGDAIARGDPLPEDLQHSVTFFKLGFGGAVTLLPGAYDYVDNGALRVVFRSLVPLVYRLKTVRLAHYRLRWRWLQSPRRIPHSRSTAEPPRTA